jgi:hypothetical protein
MLEHLLRLVTEGGVFTYEELAERLSVSQPLLEAMLEELARLDYVRVVTAGCSGHCAGCSMAGCSGIGSGHVWALTDLGTRVVVRGTVGAGHTTLEG